MIDSGFAKLNQAGVSSMTDETPSQPFIFEGADTLNHASPQGPKITETVREAVNKIGEVYETARKPGHPLSILGNVAREAPLGSLLVAFLLGVAVARRR